MYGKTHIIATESDGQGDIIGAIVRCWKCKKETTVPCTETSLDAWHRCGVFIQNAMPELEPDHRELLISGTCGECSDQMFSGSDM